jgi:phosphonopyruvate decarboxylase
MNGQEAMRIIAENRTDQLVVMTMGTSREWPVVSERWDLDLPMYGCMGKASSLGLGVALGAPDRQVLVLDGEGSLLMNLGSLVTIGAQSPGNFVHFVFDNQAYDTSGGQPTPGAGKVDFPGLAKAAGFRQGYRFDDAEQLRQQLPGILKQDGPTLIAIGVPKGWAQAAAPARKTPEAMKEMAAALKA